MDTTHKMKPQPDTGKGSGDLPPAAGVRASSGAATSASSGASTLGDARAKSEPAAPGDGRTPALLRLATAWFGGCSGCHMSFLDLDEFLIDVAGKVDLVYSP